MRSVLIILLLLVVSCRSDKKYHDESAQVDSTLIDQQTAAASVEEFQKNLDKEFSDADTSPLTDEDREKFKGLNFFPFDEKYYITAHFERTPDELPFLMPTTTERKSEEVKYGIVTFNLDGKSYKLNVYQNLKLMLTEEYKDYLFLPFSDETNGGETYGGGRYIDLRIPESDSILIDFNKAYNPYCAYNKKYSCPLVPSENKLAVDIRAGVKKYH